MSRIVHPNVNRAFPHGMGILMTQGVLEETRNGPALVLPRPMFTTYLRPQERVLFSAKRRANPFFHLFEAFWMLAGRNDAGFLNQYVHDFGDRYAEKDGTLYGAYGYRWRHNFGFDQLDAIVKALRANPTDRRIDLQMWDVTDMVSGARDVPCNTNIYFRIRQPDEAGRRVLDMSVCCRSNDAVWGLFGANTVHMSVLQEYMAWRLGCVVGSMHTMSNNFHVYKSTLWLFDPEERDHDRYARLEVAASPLFTIGTDELFLAQLSVWLDTPTAELSGYMPVFRDLLVPMARLHAGRKSATTEERAQLLDQITHTDWRAAAELWLKPTR